VILESSGWRLEPPLVPTPDEARRALQQELAHPEYHDTNIVQRLLDWVKGGIQDALDAASGSSTGHALAVMAVLLGLAGLIGWLVSRTRLSRRARDARQGGVLTEEAVSAADLRRRAEQSLADGRPADALVDGFRALTLRQVERGRLADIPGATAHEVALSLEAEYPVQSSRVDVSAALFDAVLYGGRGASAEQAQAVLGLDDELAGAR